MKKIAVFMIAEYLYDDSVQLKFLLKNKSSKMC